VSTNCLAYWTFISH